MILRSDRLALGIGVLLLAVWLAVELVGLHVNTFVFLPTWNPWPYVLLAGVILSFLAFFTLKDRAARLRFARKKWAVLAIVGFVFLVGILPVLVIIWPSPSYYTQSALVQDNLAVGVRFVSNGPMAAGNPIFAASISFQGFCPPWNVTSITMWVSGQNRSTDGVIEVGPTSVDFRTCPIGGPFTQALVWSYFANGTITFYTSGFMPVVAWMNVTHTGGFADVFTAPVTSSDVWTLPISPSDSLTSFYTLKLLGVSIIVGGAIAGWLPSVHALEEYWLRWRRG